MCKIRSAYEKSFLPPYNLKEVCLSLMLTWLVKNSFSYYGLLASFIGLNQF